MTDLTDPQGSAGDSEYDDAFEAALAAKEPPAEGRTDDGDSGAIEAASHEGQGDPEPAPADKADATPPVADSQPAADDIWANATPAQRAAYEAERKRVEALEHADRSSRGRISALTRQINGTATGGSGTDAAPRGAAKVRAMLESDAVKSAVSDYSDANGPLFEVLQAQQEVLEAFQAREDVAESERTKTFLAEQARIVTEAHSDYKEVAGSEAFTRWYEAAPESIRDMIERNADQIVDGREVASVVRLFKAETGVGEKQPGDPRPSPKDTVRARQLAGSTALPNRSQVATASVPDDFEAAFDQFAARKKVSN